MPELPEVPAPLADLARGRDGRTYVGYEGARDGRYEARVSLTPEGKRRAAAIAEMIGLRPFAGWLVVTVMVLNAELDRMMGLGDEGMRMLAALQDELDAPRQRPALPWSDPRSTPLEDARPREPQWFVLICRDCGDGDDALPMPFTSEDERAEWAREHMKSGHSRFYAVEEPRG